MVVILRRIKQFFSAVTANLTADDTAFINKYLDNTEKKLFCNMDLPSQMHCVRVARKALELAHGQSIDYNLLAKAGLLHDIGKRAGDLGLFDRTFTVLLAKAWPGLLKKIARPGKGNAINNFRHAAYIYYNHPDVGAKLLQDINAPKTMVELTANHHRPETSGDSKELILLRQADYMY